MEDPGKKQTVAASPVRPGHPRLNDSVGQAGGRDNDGARSDTIENAHASGDGALEKSDDRLEELNENEEPEDPPY
jgi:hypothetical protein